MLLSLVMSVDDNPTFKANVELLKNLYYPENLLLDIGNSILKKGIFKYIPDSKINEKAKDLINNIVAEVVKNQNYGYQVLNLEGKNLIDNFLEFPYMDNFINYFLERKHNISNYREKDSFEDLLKLKDKENCSKNLGNFNHFVNVVICLARLIQYFSHLDSYIRKLQFIPEGLMDDCEISNDDIAYQLNSSGYMRIFQLMLSGFYHDLGKTIIDQRHSIEGEIIFLADKTSTALFKLHKIVKSYKRANCDIFDKDEIYERDDLTLISKMVLYHDQFGTLGTGEDGYLRLVKIIDFIKMISINKYPGFQQKESQLSWSARTLFDLWLLNIADIIVSTVSIDKMDKFSLQENIWYDKESAFKYITIFMNSEDGANRIHDLKISYRLLFSHFSREGKLKIHVSDTKKLIQEAVDNSRFHTTERLRRLIRYSLKRPLNRLKTSSKSKRTIKLSDSIIKILNDNSWVFTIDRSLDVLGTEDQFKAKFSWIGKMDYSLGFFEKIAEETLNLISTELTDTVILFFNSLDEFKDENLIIGDFKIRFLNDGNWSELEITEDNSKIGNDHVKLFLLEDTLYRSNLARSENYDLLYKGNKISIEKVNLEPIKPTSWIRERSLVDIDDDEFLYDLNAQFFIDNYTVTIIAIISYLLNRENRIESPKDFEFLYAKERLNRDKIKKISSMVGPFQTNKSVHYILQNIYIY